MRQTAEFTEEEIITISTKDTKRRGPKAHGALSYLDSQLYSLSDENKSYIRDTMRDTMESANKSFLGKRFEFKYFLDPVTAKKVEQFLQQRAKLTVDEHAAAGGYFVNSLYFDTPHMSDYRDKDGSFLVRKKLRARMYESAWHNELQHVWLEVKHKNNMNISKTRARISGADWNAFISSGSALSLLQAETDKPTDLRHFVECYLRQQYRPLSVVRYRRVAYIADFSSPVRITFDYDIKSNRFENRADAHNLIPVSHGATIMEVKFNDRLPWWFTDLLSQFELSRTDFSKYRNGVAVMRGIQRIPISK